MKEILECRLHLNIKLDIKHREDFRNYKVNFGKAEKTLSFKPRHTVESIVNELVDNPINYNNIEIADINSVAASLKNVQPDVIVNTVAMHNVEKCENNAITAFAVNGIGVKNLALISFEINSVLIHMSTDYVFDGLKQTPYLETDPPMPLNVYGNTKLSGEYFIRSITNKYFILRTSGLYGKSSCRGKNGLNFVELMLKLAREREEIRVVNNEVVSPTSTFDLANQIVKISRSDAYGLYHATAEGSCSWYEFAEKIFTLTNTKVKLAVANFDEFPSKVPRPKYSVLANYALKKEGLNVLRNWFEDLEDYLKKQ